jgi:hypothetical protein
VGVVSGSAHLLSEAGRNPYDRSLSDLVGELSTRSGEFRTRLGGAQRSLPSDRRRSASITRSSVT